MIAKIANGGRSFKGAFEYYMHDKGAQTSDRVAWAQTENMLTDDPQLAWKVMAFTAKAQSRLKEASGQSRAGRKLENPVFTFSLSWHPEQNPDQEHMLDTAHKALEMMGMSEHESVIVAHTDEPQKHVHVIVNRVHPISGMAADIRNSKRKFSDFAREYERENGKIYCKQREENYQKRQNGEGSRYHDEVVTEAWKQTTDGKGFVNALAAKNYILAQGHSALVIVDEHGKILNALKHLKGVKAEDLHHRLQDIDLKMLPDPDSVLKHWKTNGQQDNVIAKAWANTANGKDFIKALATQNHVLAQGRKRLVVIDPQGKTLNPLRELEGVKTKDLKNRLQDIDITQLPSADDVLQQRTMPAKEKQSPSVEFEKAAGEAPNAGDNSEPSKQNDTSRRVFNKLARMKIQEMKTQHRQEVSELADQYRQRYRSSKKQWAKHYDLPRQKRKIQELVKLTANQSWWKKLTGRAKQERQELYVTLQNYQSCYRRYLENLDTIKQQRREDYTRLRDRQRSERAELKVYLHTQRKAGNFTITENHRLVQLQQQRRQSQQGQSRGIQ